MIISVASRTLYGFMGRREDGPLHQGVASMFDFPHFACAINCIDGRVQDAVRRYMIKHHEVKWVDMVTVPGPNKILAEGTNLTRIETIKEEVGVSVRLHHSKVVAIVAHPHCGGNPASKKEQIEHLRQAWETVKSFGFSVEIILLWVEEDWITVERHSHKHAHSTATA